MIIQLVLVPALVLAVLASLRSRSSLRGQARRKILAALTVVAGVLAVLFPNTLQGLADLVGVTRGTDLLLYGLALVIIYLVGSSSARFREQETRLTLLARQVALQEASIRYGGRVPSVSDVDTPWTLPAVDGDVETPESSTQAQSSTRTARQ